MRESRLRRAIGIGWLLISLTPLLPAIAAHDVSYVYDAVGRLTSVTYGDSLTTSFAYDPSGNITGITTFEGVPVGVEDPSDVPGVPSRYALAPTAPNPMRAVARFRYELPEPGPVRLLVFDVGGRQVRTLDDRFRQAGTHTVAWDGRDDSGHRVQSGVYLYRLETRGLVKTRKLVIAQ